MIPKALLDISTEVEPKIINTTIDLYVNICQNMIKTANTIQNNTKMHQYGIQLSNMGFSRPIQLFPIQYDIPFLLPTSPLQDFLLVPWTPTMPKICHILS